jgi:protein SCO1/2
VKARAVSLSLALLSSLGALSACGSGGSSGDGTGDGPGLHGTPPVVHDSLPAFTLRTTAGASYDPATATRGRVLLLYFGYTHCPDECPTSMADVAAALRRTAPAVARQVAVVFVTTDPWRDTRAVLRRWLDRYDSGFVGLTGTPTQVAGAEVAMGMPISHKEPPTKGQPKTGYSVSHFAAVFAYDREGRLATLYPSTVSPADIAADLPLLVKE